MMNDYTDEGFFVVKSSRWEICGVILYHYKIVLSTTTWSPDGLTCRRGTDLKMSQWPQRVSPKGSLKLTQMNCHFLCGWVGSRTKLRTDRPLSTTFLPFLRTHSSLFFPPKEERQYKTRFLQFEIRNYSNIFPIKPKWCNEVQTKDDTDQFSVAAPWEVTTGTSPSKSVLCDPSRCLPFSKIEGFTGKRSFGRVGRFENFSSQIKIFRTSEEIEDNWLNPPVLQCCTIVNSLGVHGREESRQEE